MYAQISECLCPECSVRQKEWLNLPGQKEVTFELCHEKSVEMSPIEKDDACLEHE
jgi:hypothetical protein